MKPGNIARSSAGPICRRKKVLVIRTLSSVCDKRDAYGRDDEATWEFVFGVPHRDTLLRDQGKYSVYLECSMPDFLHPDLVRIAKRIGRVSYRALDHKRVPEPFRKSH